MLCLSSKIYSSFLFNFIISGLNRAIVYYSMVEGSCLPWSSTSRSWDIHYERFCFSVVICCILHDDFESDGGVFVFSFFCFLAISLPVLKRYESRGERNKREERKMNQLTRKITKKELFNCLKLTYHLMVVLHESCCL